jgi:hypothetical protein
VRQQLIQSGLRRPRRSHHHAGHSIALENPAALAQAYLDFFASG